LKSPLLVALYSSPFFVLGFLLFLRFFPRKLVAFSRAWLRLMLPLFSAFVCSQASPLFAFYLLSSSFSNSEERKAALWTTSRAFVPQFRLLDGSLMHLLPSACASRSFPVFSQTPFPNLFLFWMKIHTGVLDQCGQASAALNLPFFVPFRPPPLRELCPPPVSHTAFPPPPRKKVAFFQ